MKSGRTLLSFSARVRSSDQLEGYRHVRIVTFVGLPVFCNTFVEGRVPSQKDLAKINKDEFVKRN